MLRPSMILCLLLACAGCTDPGESPRPAFAVERLDSPAAPGSSEPHLAAAPDGAVVMSWLEPDGAGHQLRHAVLRGAAWSAPRTVARGEDWFVNWADFPSVVPIAAELWAAHWLVRRPEGGYAYDVALALSRDSGATWGPTMSPHRDGTPTEHGFVTVFPWRGAVGAVWLDGREMLPPAGEHANGHGHGEGGMTLRAAAIDAAGALSGEALLDGLTCDCCQTDVALAADGPVVVYRDRSPGEIRDIFAVRHTGQGWTEAVAVANDGWRIEGCPVNGPAADARGAEVVVAWFTAADDRPRVRLARSTDGAATFGPPVDIDVDAPLGRVDVVLLEDGDAVLCWLAADRAGAAVALRRVGRDRRAGPVRIVGTTSASRPAGFPQMVQSGDRLVVAWTEVREGSRRVMAARVAVGSL